MQADIVSDLITELWKRSLGNKIANMGIEISEGSADAMQRLEAVISG